MSARRTIGTTALGLATLIAVGGLGSRVDTVAYDWVRVEETRSLMGSPFTLVVCTQYPAEARDAVEAAYLRMAQTERVFSDFDPESEVSRVMADGGADRVSDELWAGLTTTRELAELSGGTFDVTVGGLTRIWRRAMRRGILPDGESLEEARRNSGWSHVELADRSVTLHGPVRFDFGGIAKGLAADAGLQVLVDLGFPNSLVDAGGDLRIGEAPPGTRGWRVQVPVNQDEVQVWLAAHTAIATSGDNYRYLEHEGVRYSHVLDPETGLGMTDRRLVTVVAESAALADALASAFSVLPVMQGIRLAERLGVAASITPYGEPTIQAGRFPARAGLRDTRQACQPSQP